MNWTESRSALLVGAVAALVVAPTGTSRPNASPSDRHDARKARTSPPAHDAWFRPAATERAKQARALKAAALVKEQRSLNYDVRVSSPAALANLLPAGSLSSPSSAVRKAAIQQRRTAAAGLAALRTRAAAATATISDVTGAVEVVGGTKLLTASSPDSGVAIVRRFITQNKALYGLTNAEIADLRFVGESVNQVSGLRLVLVDQMVNDRYVFQSETPSSGYGTDLIGVIGLGVAANGSDGDNLVNTVIDDTAAAPNDLLVAPNTSAPMTGDWLPIYNAPSWTGFGFPTDPVGSLGRFNFLSTLGTWNVRVSDQAAGDTGTLNSWSLIVTPRSFSCTAPPTAAGVVVSGRVVNADGMGVPDAVVTLVSTSSGERQHTTTGRAGYFSLQDVTAGQTYVAVTKAEGYRFASQLVVVYGRVTDLSFTAK